jgi:hypothetical protein
VKLATVWSWLMSWLAGVTKGVHSFLWIGLAYLFVALGGLSGVHIYPRCWWTIVAAVVVDCN